MNKIKGKRLEDHGGAICRVTRTRTLEGFSAITEVRALCADGVILERTEYSPGNKRPYSIRGLAKPEYRTADAYRAFMISKGWADLDAQLETNARERKGPTMYAAGYFGIRVPRSSVLAVLPGSYRGNRIFVKAAESVILRDLNWSGGSRSVYSFHNLQNGQRADGSAMSYPAPWNNPFEGKEVPIPEGCAVVEYSQGPYSAVYIHAHPSLIPKLLPGHAV